MHIEHLAHCRASLGGFLSGSVVKNPPTIRRHTSRWFEHWVGKIPWRRAWQCTPVFLPGESHRGAWRAMVHGVTKNQMWLKWQSRHACTGHPGGSVVKNPPASAGDTGLIHGLGIALEKGMATHFSILAWRIPWTEEPERLWSMGSQRVRHNWSNLASRHVCVYHNIYDGIILYISQYIQWNNVQSAAQSFWPMDQICTSYISCTGRWVCCHCATKEAPRGTICCCYSVAKLHLSLCNPMDCKMPGLPVPESPRIYLSPCPVSHDAIQPSHPLPPSSPFAFNLILSHK